MSFITKFDLNNKVPNLIQCAIKSGYRINPGFTYTKNMPSYKVMVAKLINKDSGNELCVSTIDLYDVYRINYRLFSKDSLASEYKFVYYKIDDNLYTDDINEANMHKKENSLLNKEFGRYKDLNDYLKIKDTHNQIKFNNLNEVPSKFSRLQDYIS